MIGRSVKNLGSHELARRMAVLLKDQEPMRVAEIQRVLWDAGILVCNREVYAALKCAVGVHTFQRFHARKTPGGVDFLRYYVRDGHEYPAPLAEPGLEVTE